MNEYWLWLVHINGIGGARALTLTNYFGSARAVWETTPGMLREVSSISEQTLKGLLKKDLSLSKKIITSCAVRGIDIITIDSQDYPDLLKEIPDPPCVLYVKGDKDVLKDISISVVGSREASPYGKNIATKLAYDLAKAGFTIVSGMASGIDSFAHKGALNAGKRTVAVLGCGVDIIYPSENKDLMSFIIKNGAAVSEYPPGTRPIPSNFPARNRIISGLTLGTVVVEAGDRSGSLITANTCLEQNRQLFAVPGNIDSKFSAGTNSLLKESCSKIVTCVQDILDDFADYIFEEIENKNEKNDNNNPVTDENLTEKFERLPEEQKLVLKTLSKTPIHIDNIIRGTGFAANRISSILTMLEMNDLVTEIPGKFFIRN